MLQKIQSEENEQELTSHCLGGFMSKFMMELATTELPFSIRRVFMGKDKTMWRASQAKVTEEIKSWGW